MSVFEGKSWTIMSVFEEKSWTIMSVFEGKSWTIMSVFEGKSWTIMSVFDGRKKRYKINSNISNKFRVVSLVWSLVLTTHMLYIFLKAQLFYKFSSNSYIFITNLD